MEIQRIIQSEKQWSDMASIEGTEEMTEEQIDAMIDASFDAAMMTEKKVLTKTLNYKTGVEESYFSHTRVKLATIHSKNHEVSQTSRLSFLGLANSLYSIVIIYDKILLEKKW